MNAVLRVDNRDAICVITMNRPHRMNAFDLDLSCALRDAVLAASTDAAIRAIVIAGEGGNFCTGADLRRDRAREQTENIDLLGVLHEVFLTLRHGNKPSVAAVQGYSVGAGLSLMLACDFAVADTTSRFSAPFTGVGLAPDLGISVTLPERVGIGMARDMLLCGTMKTAAEALSGGLIDVVCEPGQVMSAALEKASALVNRAPLAIAAARKLLHESRDGAALFLSEELAIQRTLRHTQDAKEAAAAFSEKRKPVFIGL